MPFAISFGLYPSLIEGSLVTQFATIFSQTPDSPQTSLNAVWCHILKLYNNPVDALSHFFTAFCHFFCMFLPNWSMYNIQKCLALMLTNHCHAISLRSSFTGFLCFCLNEPLWHCWHWFLISDFAFNMSPQTLLGAHAANSASPRHSCGDIRPKKAHRHPGVKCHVVTCPLSGPHRLSLHHSSWLLCRVWNKGMRVMMPNIPTLPAYTLLSSVVLHCRQPCSHGSFIRYLP